MEVKMPKQKTKRITFHIPIETADKIDRLAAKDNQDASKVIRRAIDKHLSIQANKDDIDFITSIIRQEVKTPCFVYSHTFLPPVNI
jgi:Arc/MetJ-type ribon-helix-helix transcriptional regulator